MFLDEAKNVDVTIVNHASDFILTAASMISSSVHSAPGK
jgi:hypothetical protein